MGMWARIGKLLIGRREPVEVPDDGCGFFSLCDVPEVCLAEAALEAGDDKRAKRYAQAVVKAGLPMVGEILLIDCARRIGEDVATVTARIAKLSTRAETFLKRRDPLALLEQAQREYPHLSTETIEGIAACATFAYACADVAYCGSMLSYIKGRNALHCVAHRVMIPYILGLLHLSGYSAPREGSLPLYDLRVFKPNRARARRCLELALTAGGPDVRQVADLLFKEGIYPSTLEPNALEPKSEDEEELYERLQARREDVVELILRSDPNFFRDFFACVNAGSLPEEHVAELLSLLYRADEDLCKEARDALFRELIMRTAEDVTLPMAKYVVPFRYHLTAHAPSEWCILGLDEEGGCEKLKAVPEGWAKLTLAYLLPDRDEAEQAARQAMEMGYPLAGGCALTARAGEPDVAHARAKENYECMRQRLGARSAKEICRLVKGEAPFYSPEAVEALAVSRICLQLGLQYAKGEGTARDDARAFALIKEAYDTGDTYEAPYQLGLMYAGGHGVEADCRLAEAYLSEAGWHHHPEAIALCGMDK